MTGPHLVTMILAASSRPRPHSFWQIAGGFALAMAVMLAVGLFGYFGGGARK